MKNYTINEIRTSLFPIISKVFTSEFAAKYSNNVKTYHDQLAITMLINSEKIDALVKQFSFCMGSTTAINNLVKKTSSKYIVCLFERYHFLTQYLVKQNQNEFLSLPEESSDLFVYLLTDFYLQTLSM